MPDFLLPDLGEGLEEAEIVNWLVKVGEQVSIDQPIVEVETAKAVVEVPVPYAGQVTALFGNPGQTLTVGSPLITITNAASAELAAQDAHGPSDPPVEPMGANEGYNEVGVVTQDPPPGTPSPDEASGRVLIGYGTGTSTPRRQRARAKASRSTADGASEGASDQPLPPAGTAQSVISPLVRRLARDAGVNLGAVTPTGPAGVIRREDVERQIAVRYVTAGDASVKLVPPATEPPATEPTDDTVRRIPLSGARRLIAEKMSKSRREIPEATVWVDVDATDLLAARVAINCRNPDRPVSILGLFSRFAVLGLRTYSELNSHIEGNEIVIPSAVRLGLAAQTERGLVVPVVRNAQDMSARDLSEAIAGKAAAARAGKLTPAELTGGTFTVNNYGVFGVDGSAPIINHPEVAILGLGRIIDRPWVVDGRIVPRKIGQLSLAFDHRVCDGTVAGGFLRFVADCVEGPVSALGDL